MQTHVYNHKWTGYSQALPEHDDPSLDRAARWALWSARHSNGRGNRPAGSNHPVLLERPSITTAGQQAYKKWITASLDYFTHIGSTQKAACPLHREDQWTQGADTDAAQPKCQTEIFVAWNSPARRELSNERANDLKQELQRAFNDELSGMDPPPQFAMPNLKGAWLNAERHIYTARICKDDALRADSRRSPRLLPRC